MKAKLRTRVKNNETTLKDVATEFGLVDPPMRRPNGPTDSDDPGRSLYLQKPKTIGKTAQKARKKIKRIPE